MSRDSRFQNKVALVTGAGSGMGADTAILLAERGAGVTLVGRREAPLLEIEARIRQAGGEAMVAPAMSPMRPGSSGSSPRPSRASAPCTTRLAGP